MDTKIKFSVEGMQSLHQAFQDILNDSKALTVVWAEHSTSVTESLKEQIELLKERNSIAGNLSGNTGSQFQAGNSQELVEISSIIQSWKTEGVLIHKDSIEALLEGLGGTRGTNSSTTQEGPGISGTTGGKLMRFGTSFAFTNLMRGMNASDPVSAMLGLGSNIGSALMMTGNPYAMVAGALVSVLSNVASIRQNAIKGAVNDASLAAGVFGGNYTGYLDQSRNWTGLGIGRAEALQRQIEYGRLFGLSAFDAEKVSLSSSQIEKALGIDRGTLSAFATTGRGDSGFNMLGSVDNLLAYLKETGLSQERLSAQANEYLKLLTDLNQQQVSLLGVADTDYNARMMAFVQANLPSNVTRNPQMLAKVGSAFYSGLTSASTSQAEALQYSILARLAPNATWLDLQAMREDPSGARATGAEKSRRQQYLGGMIDALRTASGGSQTEFGLLLKQMFPQLSWNDALDLSKGGLNVNDLNTKLEAASRKDELQKELPQKILDVVSGIAKNTAAMEDWKIGEKFENYSSRQEAWYTIMNKPQNKDERREKRRLMWDPVYFLRESIF